MKAVRKSFLNIVIIVLIFLEAVCFIGTVRIAIIPSAKFLITFNSVENDLSTLAQEKYYVLENNSLPNDMAQRFNRQKVNNFFHAFLDELNPYIMFSYMPDLVDDLLIQCRVANSNFFNLYEFALYEGRKFEAEDFVCRDTIPIIVGYNLRNQYEIGKTYTFYHGDEGRPFVAQIAGVLDKNAMYPSLQEVKESLDNSYIIPMSDYFIDNYFGMSDYDLAVSSALIKSDESCIVNMIEQSREINFWNLDEIAVSTALAQYNESMIQPLTNRLFLSIALSALLLGLVIWELLFLIRNHKRSER